MNKVKRELFLKSGNQKSVGGLTAAVWLLVCAFLLSACGTGKADVLFERGSGQTEMQEVQVWVDESPEKENQEDSQQQVPEEGTGIMTADASKEPTCYVYVCGAVANPGVYEVEPDTRVCEVIQYAGGLTGEAETTCVNQALAVYDGLMLVIPTVCQWENGDFSLDEKGFPVQVSKTREALEENVEASPDDGKVNINEATIEQLCTLPGVGESRAESIIAYRQEHGRFEAIEDIKKVSGIKEGLFEKIKEKIKV